jgi:predicted aconitase
MMINLDNLNIHLTQEESGLLNGDRGPVMANVMQSIVLYGEALSANKLVEIEGPGHFVIAWASPGIAPPIEMLEELVAAGLKTKYPFTLDPRPPLDFENLFLSPEEQESIVRMYKAQPRYDELMIALGLRDENAYTCNPYQPEVGNIPKPGTVLAWSESACAIFANSVLGARTNRNGAIIDLLSNIVGKTPFIGLITDDGRKADWLIQLQIDELPNPQLLGAVIGSKVQMGVPFITGLARLLKNGTTGRTIDYLQELGAACATYSAIDLFHIEHITPEAVEYRRDLLSPEHSTYTITEDELQNHYLSYPSLWTDEDASPSRCYIGCPHLSLNQLYWWLENLEAALQKSQEDHIAIQTTICAAPQVLIHFKSDGESYSKLENMGVKLSPACCETVFETQLNTGKPIITNSNKLRAYTTARFLPDEKLLDVLVNGELTGVEYGR